MQFRLRSLFLSIAAVALAAAILGAIRQSNRPIPITSDPTGKQALAQLSAADSIQIELHSLQGLEQLDVPPERRPKLVAWLSNAIRDKSPAKYEIYGNLALNPPTKTVWFLMTITAIELGICTDGNYWRGLNRQEFENLENDLRQRKNEVNVPHTNADAPQLATP